jgi:hypothetical protein
MELKPRVKTGVILSISASELDYLSLQLVDGAVKFALDNGAGPQMIVHTLPAVNALCDGHWHNIKVQKNGDILLCYTVSLLARNNIFWREKKICFVK